MHVNDKMITGHSQRGFIEDKSCLTSFAFCEKMSGFVREEGEVDIIYLAFR